MKSMGICKVGHNEELAIHRLALQTMSHEPLSCLFQAFPIILSVNELIQPNSTIIPKT